MGGGGGGDGGVRLRPLDDAGRPSGPVHQARDLVSAVREQPEVTRWVWQSTAAAYGRLLAAGVRVERCYNVEVAETLLLGYAGQWGRQPRSLAAAWARLRGLPVPEDPPVRTADTQPSLFEAGPPPLPPGTDPLEALLAVYADQVERTAAVERPEQMRLLITAESAGMLVAAEMRRAGVPWRADAHRQVLAELLGERYAGGQEPWRLTELADEISRAFGSRVRPDLPGDIVRAFARADIRIGSTRAWELREIDHPAVEPLLRYKKALPALHRARLVLAPVLGARRAVQTRVPAGPSTCRAARSPGAGPPTAGARTRSPKVVRRTVIADPGWRLVVADAEQMEPRVLAAISRDRGLMEVAGGARDLYAALSDRAFAGDRAQAKLALLGAIYGQTSGDALKHLADLRRRFPAAVAYVDEAARAGEEGRLVRTWLGRTCPSASQGSDAGSDEAGLPQAEEDAPPQGAGTEGGGSAGAYGVGAQARARGGSRATSWCRAARPTGPC